MIQLTPIPDDLLTAYIRGGGTRKNGKLVPDVQALTVKQAHSEGWRLAPSVVADLVRLDQAVLAAGGARIRLVDAYRNPKVQAEARAKYERWVSAGKPDPSGARFNRKTMKSAYVARAGESHHGWGGAIDIDVGALAFRGTGTGTDAALSRFWDLAQKFGFFPIITDAIADQSEAWHFEHLGPFSKVKAMFIDRAADSPRYRRPSPLVAAVACILVGTLPKTLPRMQMRQIQARLLIGGFWCGEPDGHLGRKTVSALRSAGLSNVTLTTNGTVILAGLNALDIGTKAMSEV